MCNMHDIKFYYASQSFHEKIGTENFHDIFILNININFIGHKMGDRFSVVIK